MQTFVTMIAFLTMVYKFVLLRLTPTNEHIISDPIVACSPYCLPMWARKCTKGPSSPPACASGLINLFMNKHMKTWINLNIHGQTAHAPTHAYMGKTFYTWSSARANPWPWHAIVGSGGRFWRVPVCAGLGAGGRVRKVPESYGVVCCFATLSGAAMWLFWTPFGDNIVHMGRTTAQKTWRSCSQTWHIRIMLLLLGIPPKLIHLQAHHGHVALEQCYEHFDAQTAHAWSTKPSVSSWIHASLKTRLLVITWTCFAKTKQMQMCHVQQPHKFLKTSWRSHHSLRDCFCYFTISVFFKQTAKTNVLRTFFAKPQHDFFQATNQILGLVHSRTFSYMELIV